MNRRDPHHRDTLAAEYALGTLRGAARRRFERWLRDDPELEGMVHGWERRLGPLLDDVAPVTPPKSLWSAIEARITPAEHPKPRLWDSLAFWRSLGMAASALLVVLAVALYLPGQPAGPMPDRMLVVEGPSGQAEWVLTLDAASQRLIMKAVHHQHMPPDKACQLWAVSDEGAMHPVGLLPEVGGKTMPLDRAEQARLLRSKLAITLEPNTGKPSLTPQGEKVWKGEWLTI